jgi:hypothetical protein
MRKILKNWFNSSFVKKKVNLCNRYFYNVLNMIVDKIKILNDIHELTEKQWLKIMTENI